MWVCAGGKLASLSRIRIRMRIRMNDWELSHATIMSSRKETKMEKLEERKNLARSDVARDRQGGCRGGGTTNDYCQ